MTNAQCQAGKQRTFKMPSLPTHTPSASSGRCQSRSWRRDTPQTRWSGPCMCTTPTGEWEKPLFTGWLYPWGKNFPATLNDLTCWMTFTKSLSTCLRFRTSLLVMTAVVRYRRMCGHIVWMAFRYLGKKKQNTKAAHSGIIISCHHNRFGSY